MVDRCVDPRRCVCPSAGAAVTRNARIDALSRALIRLHKALLDSERTTYERVHGRIETNGAFFQLVLNDGWFAWLRPLSQAIAQLDELNEDPAPESQAQIPTVVADVRTLLVPLETGDGFGRQYYEAIQRDPEVGLAHGTVRALLSAR